MSTTTSREKQELVWLPAHLAQQIKDLADGAETEKAILNYIQQSKDDLRINIESMEDDIVQYRAFMIKARQEFEKAKNEQLEASYSLWEKFDEQLGTVRDYVGRIKKEIEPLKNELADVKKLMGEVETWNVEKLLTTLQNINSSFYGETGNILRFLFDNYKKPEAAQ